jgi:uncharacterized phage-associated protein
MASWFNSRKAAQVAAFFCQKQGDAIYVLKLVKLIYLADREFMAECGFTITNDLHVSMDHGPVNSCTLNLIDGNTEADDWSDLISDRAQYQVGLARPLTEDDTDELSDAEVDALGRVWDRFGHMGRYDIRDWTHKNCPEWENPHGSSTAIPVQRTLQYLGVENPELYAKRSEIYRDFRHTLVEVREDIADSAW